MTISIHTAKHYLERWGAYMRSDRLTGLGYPSVEQVYKMAVGSNAAVDIEEPEGVRIMQSIYLAMPDDVREIVDITYKDNLSFREASKKLNVSTRYYRDKLNDAQHYVRGALQFYNA